ncbi:F-box only protein 4-like [Elysia marginata]|uniref:F-box only protein 4-like n=1 Tax=Elysia marginata TaxID=1093978 RepID=A0AAV4JA79_9GAST|nr:F-box only protein 4-like [Elysia marginata]
MYSNSLDTQVTSGGLQQFIFHKLKQKSKSGSNDNQESWSWTQRLRAIYTKEPQNVSFDLYGGGGGSFFQCLPVKLKLKIFSYLSAQSLCVACCVCRDWSMLTSDPSLWRSLLIRDIRQWPQISHLSNPQLYLEVNSDWSQKEIYLKCSPAFQRQLKAATSTFQQVSSVLKSFMPRKVPRVAMFGPGLETSTSGLVRCILYEDSNTFQRVAMFPGQFEGMGGGITLRLPAGHSLHLSVLYSASKQERENRAGVDRLEGNKLLQKLDGDQAGDSGNNATGFQYELKPQLRHLCQTLDGFIFVVDATQSLDSMTRSRAELQAMLRERKSVPVPVLVLSCTQKHEDVRHPACDVVKCLDMASLTQPWLVIDCVTDTLNSIDDGIVWLVEQCQLR